MVTSISVGDFFKRSALLSNGLLLLLTLLLLPLLSAAYFLELCSLLASVNNRVDNNCKHAAFSSCSEDIDWSVSMVAVAVAAAARVVVAVALRAAAAAQ